MRENLTRKSLHICCLGEEVLYKNWGRDSLQKFQFVCIHVTIHVLAAQRHEHTVQSGGVGWLTAAPVTWRWRPRRKSWPGCTSSWLQHTATLYNTLQHPATPYHTLQHPATQTYGWGSNSSVFLSCHNFGDTTPYKNHHFTVKKNWFTSERSYFWRP